ncbi:uncharacterized protein LOC118926659 isoform X2 [Manis pentadactyla]|uniref:uncharacterized protein LOC118926659 isoform X2 n=1 Tax=Manis pentadactyla TaxID=143292 RepID=UPI00255C3E4E|nr:uncharacterized protein LOC118926659 isoform X2 [Manis pentadactyla]
MLPPLRFLRACAPVSLCTNNISVSLRLSGLRAEQRVNLCLFPCRHICLGVNLQVLPCLWIFCASVGLCVYPCICHSMRGHRSLCVSQSLWLESFSAYACLRVTFVYLCVFLNDSVCSHVVRSFWVCVCGFVSTCISRVFVVSVSRTVDEWKWSFSQTPFVPWPCAAWKPQAVSSRALGGGEDPRRGWSTRPSSSPPGAEEPEGTDQGLQDLQLHPALRARPASASPSAPGLGHLQIAGGRQTGPEPPQAMGWIGGCHSRDAGRDSEAWELRKCSQTAPADAEYLNLHSELVVTMFGSMVPSCA